MMCAERTITGLERATGSARTPQPFHRFTIATVFFAAELGLMKLQARSLAKYLDAENLVDIYVIFNSPKPLSASDQAALLTEYGHLVDHVKILTRSSLSLIPATSGWRSQQLLKLLIADKIRTTHYIVLDAKTHLVSRLERSFLATEDGRATVNTYSYDGHPLEGALRHVSAVARMPLNTKRDAFPATVPPITLITEVVRDLLRRSSLEGRSAFASFFLKNDLTEFFYYFMWLKSLVGDYNSFYYAHQRFCPALWGHTTTADDVAKAISLAADRSLPFFNTHRRSLAKLDGPAQQLLSTFWAERALFETPIIARRFIGDTQRAVARTEWLTQLRERLDRYASIPRRAVRKARRVGASFRG